VTVRPPSHRCGHDLFSNARAGYLERTYVSWSARTKNRETVYATPRRRELLKRLQKSKALSRDAWLERKTPDQSHAVWPQIQSIEGECNELG
jgi:hypothetical protein